MTRDQLKAKIDQLLEDQVESQHIEPFKDREALLNALTDLVAQEADESWRDGANFQAGKTIY